MATTPVLLMLLALLSVRFDTDRRIEDTLVLIELLPIRPTPAPVPPPRRERADPGGRSAPASRPRIDPAPGAAPRSVDATAAPAAPPLPVAPPLEMAAVALGASAIGLDFGGDDGGDGQGGRGTGSGSGSGEGGDEIWYKPRWVRQPTDADLAPFAPPAMAAGVSGEVVLACRVRLSRSLERCEVLRESPAGKGFGRASLAASRIFRVHPPRQNGKPVDRGRVAIPISWVSLVPPPPPPKEKP